MASQWITTPESANRASMLSRTDTRARGLADLPPVVNDSLLALIALCDADPRPEKIDVGVGVFRDAVGNTPILKVMKEAEQRLVDTQVTKAYLRSGGDKRFAGRLRSASPRFRADCDRQSGRARARRHADLAQPSADHQFGPAADGRISLLRAGPGDDPLRGH